MAARLRCGLEPGAVLALGLLALIAVVFAAHSYIGGQPRTVGVPASVSAQHPAHPRFSGFPAVSPAPGPARSVSRTVVVDVAGKVRHPGVRKLPAGSRVSDALREAGGALPGTDTSSLNLARLLADGEQVLVGGAQVPGPMPPGGAGIAGDPPATQVSLNSATAEQLETLPGVGPVLARHIIDYRTGHGGFSSVDQLREVNGIGPHRFSDLKPLVRP